MRFLNKIIFINSAAIKYSEINLDGNVHFIGTQGVGKSTILRAILFFYNAKKDKLGISIGKRNFDHYYFQYPDSYIVYEVSIDTICFCVLAYKVNGKVTFRFFNSAYKKEFFIDAQGFAFESWEGIRNALGDIYSTSKISSYEEYRKILYGDNKGLKSEFHKYALLESSQYKNIPRTIQNVLLNSNLEASLIKETIVDSVSEDEFTIDLSNYEKSHLNNFKCAIQDIEIWHKKDKNGQISIRNQADKVIENNNFLKSLQQKKQALAANLATRMAHIKTQKPIFLINYQNEKKLLNSLFEKQTELSDLHKTHGQRIISKVDNLKGQLELARKKQLEYQSQKIALIIDRVSKKDDWENEKKANQEEQILLSAKFSEISQKYKALMAQNTNQQNEFNNQKNAKINRLEGELNTEKLSITKDFDTIIKQITIDNNTEIQSAKNTIKALNGNVNSLNNDISELTHKVFFTAETKKCRDEETTLKEKILIAKNIVKQSKSKNIAIRQEWDFTQEKIITKYNLKIEKQQTQRQTYKDKITSINNNLANRKSSLYGWLNEEIEDWEQTIGKVIDVDNVLFNSHLTPKLSSKQDGFFGLEINLDALDVRVKTLTEYANEVKTLQEKITQASQEIDLINSDKDAELKNLTIKFKKQLKILKGQIFDNEKIVIPNSEQSLKDNQVNLDEWLEKSKTEKQNELQRLNKDLEQILGEKEIAKRNLVTINEKIVINISKQEKHRDDKIAQIEGIKSAEITTIKKSIDDNNTKSSERFQVLKNEEKSELNNKGADTKRLGEIEQQLREIGKELQYIEYNTVLVIEYNKDKRELFDKVPQYEVDKESYEVKQKQQEKTQKIEHDKLKNKLDLQSKNVESIKLRVDEFTKDEEEFDEFIKTDVFFTIQDYFKTNPNFKDEQVKTAYLIINDLWKNDANNTKQLNDLRQSVNRFTSNFDEDNIFKLKIKFNTDVDIIDFATDLAEFIEEDKISEYENRVNERFTDIVRKIANETKDLISKRVEIEKIITKINNDFSAKNFVEAIKKMEMRVIDSSNSVVRLLLEIRDFVDENDQILGTRDIFNIGVDTSSKNKKAIELLSDLVGELERYDEPTLTLLESFDLEFRIVENDNDSSWVEKLSSVGSEGTDILVKAMINILLLSVFKDNASKKFKDFKLHCPMDEIGRLDPRNIKGILKFANERNILLINASPISLNATAYKYTYKLSKDQAKTNNQYVTKVTKLISKLSNASNP